VTTVAFPQPAGFFGRLKAFADNVFEPKLHTLFAAFWSLSLLGNLHAVSGVQAWRWDATLVVLVLSVFVCLFFLRMVDEVKDYDYDVVHNPDRPLVSGLVTRADIVRYCAGFAAVVLSLNSALGVALAAWLAADMAYGLLQLVLERHFRAVRENLLVNLIAVYPVNVGLSVYTLLFFLKRTGVAFDPKQAWLVVAYACAFLHFEFARKSLRPELAEPGERLYSQIMGLGASLAVSVAFGLAAMGLSLWLLEPWTKSGGAAVAAWSPLLCFLPMGLGLALQAKNRERRHKVRPPAVAFLFTFYLSMMAHALVTRTLVWGAS
jgi:hypothetical protein